MKPSSITRAVELLRAGRLVVFPTETVYGLGANALDEAAVRKIFEAKGRPHSSPLIVHVASIEMARGLAREWPEKAEILARRFWPGPLTIVVPKNADVPDVVTAGLPSVGLRMPAHPVARALLEAAGIPVAAPSANRFTELSPTRAEDVPKDLADMILDGGQCAVGIESTVVSLVVLNNDSPPRILRPGMISQTQIEEAIGPVEVAGGAESPGQHPRHYSPKTPVVLDAVPREGRGVRLDFDLMPVDPAEYAERLYSILHDLDREGYDWIAVEMPPDTLEWAGIRDRLTRAAHREQADTPLVS